MSMRKAENLPNERSYLNTIYTALGEGEGEPYKPQNL